jgi:hypothetical protein
MGLGSEIRNPEKTYSGSRIWVRNTATDHEASVLGKELTLFMLIGLP